jgi:hypothetical protein
MVFIVPPSVVCTSIDQDPCTTLFWQDADSNSVVATGLDTGPIGTEGGTTGVATIGAGAGPCFGTGATRFDEVGGCTGAALGIPTIALAPSEGVGEGVGDAVASTGLGVFDCVAAAASTDALVAAGECDRDEFHQTPPAMTTITSDPAATHKTHGFSDVDIGFRALRSRPMRSVGRVTSGAYQSPGAELDKYSG